MGIESRTSVSLFLLTELSRHVFDRSLNFASCSTAFSYLGSFPESIECDFMKRLRIHTNNQMSTWLRHQSKLKFWVLSQVTVSLYSSFSFNTHLNLTFLAFLYKIDIKGFQNQQKLSCPRWELNSQHRNVMLFSDMTM